MRGYLFISWPLDQTSCRMAGTIRRAAIDAGCMTVDQTEGSWCGAIGPHPPPVHHLPCGGLVIGDFVPAASAPSLPAVASAVDVAAHLTQSAWGRYVVIFRDATNQARSVYRDPSGALEAFSWRVGTLTILASATPDWLIHAARPAAVIDWDRLADVLQTPAMVFSDIALQGLEAVNPGEWLDLQSGRRLPLWSPETISRDPFTSVIESVGTLRSSLDHVVSVLTRDKTDLGAEVSGGLDSAIVVGAHVARGGRLKFALNTYSSYIETDERAYAELVAAQSGVGLTRRARPYAQLDAEKLERSAGDPRPSQNGRDVFNDEAVADACRVAGVTALLTGKGGDALFFQGHTPLAFSDQWQAKGWRALGSPLLPGVARWTRTSAWSVLSTARRHAALDRESRRRGDLIPAPAKRLQIALIKSGLAYYSTCRRADQVDMIHPLMSQPLIEWALRTPVYDLVEGGRDRALAREAFADRLPEAVRRRRSKGDYSAYFNHQIASNLAFLRSYLLDGRLAAQGLLDRPTFEALMDSDSLRWRGGATDVLAAASLEAWVRCWEARLGPPGARQDPQPAECFRTND